MLLNSLYRLDTANKPSTSNSWLSNKLRSVLRGIFLWFQLPRKNLKKQNFWKKQGNYIASKLTRLRLIECDHEDGGMKWIRKSCVFDTFPFGRAWKHDDIRKVEVKIFLWANLEKSKNRRISAEWRKIVFKKEEKAFEENLNFKIVTVAYFHLMS